MDEIISTDSFETLNAEIKIIGVGGSGNHIVANLYRGGLKNTDFIICSKSVQSLTDNPVPNKIQLSDFNEEILSGHISEAGEQMASGSIDKIKKIFSQKTKVVFIVAGLGRIVGTGVTPIIAREAKKMKILTVAVATFPCTDEGEEVYKIAEEGLPHFKGCVDSLLILNNQNLLNTSSDISVFDFSKKVDATLTDMLKGILDLIITRDYLYKDFAKLSYVLRGDYITILGQGRATGENRVQKVFEQGLSIVSLGPNGISEVEIIFVVIRTGNKRPLTDPELRYLVGLIKETDIPSFVTAEIEPVFVENEPPDDEISMTILASGFPMGNRLLKERIIRPL
jgi:cell division protein FtsZ